jgi:phospholipid/cholesterol/gamma-HCH transport system ATP-binding protein
MIAITNLCRRLGGKQVLGGVDLEIRNGETVVVLGPSGTGKSVLLKHIIGLMRPDSGSIKIDGEEVVGLRERDLNVIRRKFGMLFQGAALFDSMTVGENVALALREHTDFPPEQIEQRVRERLEWVGLSNVEEMKPASLSGGMRKRVGLARAIVLDPQYILYDEPTTGLDPIMADVIDDLIVRMQERLGVTSVVVTHDLKSAVKIADRLAMLYAGKIVFIGTPQEMEATPDPLMRQFREGTSREGPIQPV